MFRHFLSTLDWLASAQGINGLFALLCLAAALGGNARLIMLLSAALYLALTVL
jgi:hypothetical protein